MCVKTERWEKPCLLSVNQPAAVIVGVSLQGGCGPGQAHPRERVVVSEHCVRQAGHTVRLVVHALPVRVQCWRSLREGTEQIGVQLVHNLLVDAGFKLPGKEGGPHRLLQREEEGGAR